MTSHPSEKVTRASLYPMFKTMGVWAPKKFLGPWGTALIPQPRSRLGSAPPWGSSQSWATHSSTRPWLCLGRTTYLTLHFTARPASTSLHPRTQLFADTKWLEFPNLSIGTRITGAYAKYLKWHGRERDSWTELLNNTKVSHSRSRG